MTQAPSGSMQCSPRAWMCLQDPLTLGLGEWMFSLVGQSPGPQRLTLGSPTALHPNPRPALLQEQDLMTHPGAGPGWAGGGWAEAWSEQRVRGQEPCLHWAAAGDFAGLSTAAPGADCSNWRAAPWPAPPLADEVHSVVKVSKRGPCPRSAPTCPATSDQRSGPAHHAHCHTALPGGGTSWGSADSHFSRGLCPHLAARSAWLRATSRSPACATRHCGRGAAARDLDHVHPSLSLQFVYRKALICGQLS